MTKLSKEQEERLDRILTGGVDFTLIDADIRDWAFHAREYGGAFVCAIATAILHADPENFALLRPTAIHMIEKYPKYLKGPDKGPGKEPGK